MPINRLVAALLLGLLWLAPAEAARCSFEEAEAADALVEQLDSWSKVETIYQQYGGCDEGDIAEGISEAVMRLLVDQWALLPQLAKLARSDPALERFVLAHVKATADAGDLQQVVGLAASSCPPESAALCSKLKAAATRAAK
jgi:hypothetical protein